MNGAESLVHTAAAAGVRVCFANPGTTELAIVKALDDVPGIRAVLGLFEGVCSGAADGYARMLDVPALTLLHLGPGLANALANLHNARRARSPVVNVVGDHATWHRGADAPLASDIAALAGTVSRWVRSTPAASRLAGDVADAIAAAQGGAGGVATLVVPTDCQDGAAAGAAEPVRPGPAPGVPAERVEAVAAALRSGAPAALLSRRARAAGAGAVGRRARLGEDRVPGRRRDVPRAPGARRRAASAGAAPVLPRARGRLPRGAHEARARGRPGAGRVLRLPGDAEPPHAGGLRADRARVARGGRAGGARGPRRRARRARGERRARAGQPARVVEGGPLTADSIGPALALLQPEGAIIVDESATSGAGYFSRAAASPRHSYLSLTGGSIGMGPSCAVGAAIACPGRTVINLQGDGGAMYTLQALWTQAREGLHVVTLICANRSYRILQLELARAGVSSPGPLSGSLTGARAPGAGLDAAREGDGRRRTRRRHGGVAPRRALPRPRRAGAAPRRAGDAGGDVNEHGKVNEAPAAPASRSEAEPTLVLRGIRVLDFGRYIAGPYCAALLAEHGAEVIRIERRERQARTASSSRWPPDGEGALFLQMNRNKRAMTLDPTSAGGARDRPQAGGHRRRRRGQPAAADARLDGARLREPRAR